MIDTLMEIKNEACYIEDERVKRRIISLVEYATKSAIEMRANELTRDDLISISSKIKEIAKEIDKITKVVQDEHKTC